MKIALVSPLCEAVPPRLYGGTERVVAHLADALVALGHDVTLFASAEARTKARLVGCRDQAIRLDPQLSSDLAAHLAMLHELRRRADEFDVIHFHIDMLHFPLFEDRAARTLTTLHGRLDIKDLPPVYARWSDYPLISISDAQRKPIPLANWAGTVHHGLDRSLYKFSPRSEGYLAFLGRISPEKRPDRAIEIAVRLGRKLKIAAKVDSVDQRYFEDKIEPLLIDQPLVEFIGEINDEQKSGFLGGADAVLFPIDWPEPFGLVMIEAMACGTPVVAFDGGSVREVVDEGVTGFVVRDIAGALSAVGRAAELDRGAVRRRFEARFTAEVMARRYVEIYQALARDCERSAIVAA
jgi:glycosyltransferase involved in cell wall biosynthesis